MAKQHERLENAKAAAADRMAFVKNEIKKVKGAFEPHPGSTPAGHKKKGKG